MKMKLWLTPFLACGIASVALCQQTATPQTAISGPSLAATVQIVQSTLNEQGKLNWTTHHHDSADGKDWTNQLTFTVSKLVADASACTIAYHAYVARDGVVLEDQDASFNLHDVQDLTLTTGDQRQYKNDAVAGHPTWTAKVDPPIFDLVVRGQGTAEYYFILTNEDTANRATKAMGHAVELCGGNRGSF